MPRQRLTTTLALLALGSCCALAPAASASSTLLSGYGGPGEGNQAILGSAVIGGAGGSKGGGGGSTGGGSAGASSATPQPVSIEASPAPQPTQRQAGTTGSGGHAATGKPQAHPRSHKAAGTTTAAGATAPAKAVVVRSVSAPALGLSGTDVAYVVLAFLVLMLTAFVTALLTRGEQTAQGGRGEIDSR